LVEIEGEKESSAILKKMKREISFKDPSLSTWEVLCYLEEDSVDRNGRDCLGMVLGKYLNE
jgi:hypothetical protein